MIWWVPHLSARSFNCCTLEIRAQGRGVQPVMKMPVACGIQERGFKGGLGITGTSVLGRPWGRRHSFGGCEACTQ